MKERIEEKYAGEKKCRIRLREVGGRGGVKKRNRWREKKRARQAGGRVR